MASIFKYTDYAQKEIARAKAYAKTLQDEEKERLETRIEILEDFFLSVSNYESDYMSIRTQCLADVLSDSRIAMTLVLLHKELPITSYLRQK